MPNTTSPLSTEKRRICEALPFALCVLDLSAGRTELLLVSDGLCHQSGYSRSELNSIGTDPAALIHPEDRTVFASAIEGVRQSPEKEFCAELRLKKADGLFSPFSCHGSREPSADGSLLLYITCSQLAVKKVPQPPLAQETDTPSADSVLNLSPALIYWKDNQRRFVGANRAFLNYVGISDASALIGRTSEEMGWLVDPQTVKEDEQRLLREGVSLSKAHSMIAVGGHQRLVLSSKRPAYAGGTIVGLVGTSLDITEEFHRKAELARLNAELEHRSQDLSMVMEATGVCISKIRLKDMGLIWGNDAMYKTIGFSREEYEKQFHSSMFLFFRGFESEMDKLKIDMEKAQKMGRESFRTTLRIPTKSGPVWIRGLCTFTDFDKTGPQSLYTVYMDISDEIQTEQRLHEAELQRQRAEMLSKQNEQLTQMIDNVPAAISVFRGRPGIWGKVMSNHYLADIFGMPRAMEGILNMQDYLALIHPDDYQSCSDKINQMVDDGTPLEGVYRFCSPKTGQYVWALVRANVMRFPGEEIVIYTSYTNINALKQAEAQLRERQHMYETALRTADLVVWTYDIASHTVTMSDDEQSKVDYAKFKIAHTIYNVPDSLADFIDPADRQKFIDMYRQADQGHDTSGDIWYKAQAGQESRCEHITLTVITDDSGHPLKAYGMGHNITAEKKVQERYEREMRALREGNAENLVAKGHYNLTQNKVLEYTTTSDKVFTLNQPAATYDEAYARFLSMSYQESDRREITDKLNRENLIHRYQQGIMQTSLQYRRSIPDSTPIWISMDIHTYMMPTTGDVECFTYAHVITEKVLGEQMLSKLTGLGYDELGMIYAKNGSCRIYRISNNPAADIFRDYSNYDETMKKYIAQTVAVELQDKVWSGMNLETVKKGLVSEKVYSYSNIFRCGKDGVPHHKLFQMTYQDESHDTIFFCESDVSEQYRKENEQILALQSAKMEAERANAAKSGFLSSMSHDLRTPLSGIIGFTDIALREADPAKVRDYLTKIKISGDLLLALVNDTLELSRIESGRMTLQREAVDSREAIESVVTALRPSAEMKGIDLQTDLANFKRETVWIDRLKMEKLLLNLLSNAIKYTRPDGIVKLIVQDLDPTVNGHNRRFIIEDNGIGMSADFLKKLYEPFSQEHRPEASSVVGTGLGLAIVKRIVDLIGGSISVQSEIDRGTRFTVDLTIHQAEKAQAVQKAALDRQKTLDGKNILLCEDNELNREIASILLKEKGMTVDCAENGLTALGKFRDSPTGQYDAVLMDLRMPVMDGYQATRSIRTLERPDAKTVPIIAMTADAFAEDIKKCLNAGMNGHIAKPIMPQQLYEELLKAMA